MRTVGLIFSLAACLFIINGCASKASMIQTEPPGAYVEINGDLIGKSPVHYRFYDNFQLWSFKGTDKYTVHVRLDGYEPDTRTFLDTPGTADPSFVPDVIFFKLTPSKE